MRFRWKLLFAFTATTLVAVAVVAIVATRLVRASYLERDRRRIEQVLRQAESYIQRRGELAERHMSTATEDEAVTRIGIALNQPAPAMGSFLADAAALARAHDLDLLQIIADDGTVLSSAQWEARAGYSEPGLQSLPVDRPFVRPEDLPAGQTLAVEAIREVPLGARKLYLLGGYRLDDALTRELSQSGLEYVMLFRLAGPGKLEAAGTSPPSAVGDELRRVAERVVLTGADYRGEQGTGAMASSTVAAMPIRDARGNTLGALVLTVSGGERAQVIRSLYWAALSAGVLGVVVALLLSVVLAHRITAPVTDLVRASREVAAGNLDYRIQPRGDDEVARLSRAFNQMAASLREHRERLVQAERVAAWRELARRLAHELKNPLFPLQLSIENLRRARQVDPAHFNETFEEATTTLLTELDELKRVVARFSDFAKMPQPQVEPTDLHALLERTARVYESRIAQQKIALELTPPAAPVTASVDPHLLGNALGNLILNALDAMPAGGRLRLGAYAQNGRAVVEVADTGQGLTAEERERIFTPYYTTKRHGTGLGLAMVQSVVADHGGRITVESAPQQGTRFRIELPV